MVVNDAFGSVTSSVANLTFSTNAAAIVNQPSSQLVPPGASSVTFNVTTAGDAPLSFQWRTNGVAIPGATNTSYTVANPGPADAANAIDFVVANPCATVTSMPPVNVIFLNQFLAGYDAGPGFFSGEDLMLTNTSGANLYVWSSPDLTVPVLNWTFEGQMSEQVFNNTSGTSLYSINVNPATSPVYYFFAKTNAGPYMPNEPIASVATADYVNFTVADSIVSMSPSGLLDQINFLPAYDAGPGFFSGEDLTLTNASGVSLFVWSSPDPSMSVTNWTLEGQMSEQVFNNNSGTSLYSINVNPATSPIYYIFAQTNNGIFTSKESVVWLTTVDYLNFTVTGTSAPITTNGIFIFANPPSITQSPQSQTLLAGQNASLNLTATGAGLGYQWFFNNNGLVGAAAPVLGLINLSATNSGAYFVIVSNSSGSVTSSIATITVASPPVLRASYNRSNGVQLTANTITNLIYAVQSATNLAQPVWLTLLTNNTGLSGLINFQTNSTGNPRQFYRLFFPSAFPLPPQIILPPQSQTVLAGQSRSLSVSANDTGASYQWFFNNNAIAGATNRILSMAGISAANVGTYAVIVTNALGSITSSIATLNVASPPIIKLVAGPLGTIQLKANSITGLTYVVQMSTNLFNSRWLSILTNSTDATGLVNFQTNAAALKSGFYRLSFP